MSAAADRRRDRVPDRAAELSREIASAVLIEPALASDVAEILRPRDLPAPAQNVLDAVLDLARAGRGATLADVAAELRSRDLLATVGGEIGLAQLSDLAATAAYAIPHARELREIQRDARRRYLHGVLAADPDDIGAHAEIGAIEREMAEGETPAAPRLRVLSASEFEADAAPASIVETLIYEGSTHSLNGASKAGKTWAAIQLAMAVGSGDSFLGLASAGCSVLYLSFELSAGMLRQRMRDIAAGTGIPAPAIGETFHVVAPTADFIPSLDLGNMGGVADLGRLIEATGSRFVVLDTLYRFLPGCDPNDNGEMGRVYGRLNDLASRTGAGLLLLDHVGKGEHTGPVSHSALGASVKGGASRAVIALRRTSRDDGGRWQLDVESHFGSWEEPLYYERPKLPDGTRGGGCVLCSASEAHGMKFATVHKLFSDYGERDANGHAYFGSKRKLIAALEAAKHSSGNAQGQDIVAAIQRDYAIPEYLAGRYPDRPILTRDGGRNAVVFTWRMAEAPEEATTWI